MSPTLGLESGNKKVDLPLVSETHKSQNSVLNETVWGKPTASLTLQSQAIILPKKDRPLEARMD